MPKISKEKRPKSKKKKSRKKNRKSRSGKRTGDENKEEAVPKEELNETGKKKSSKSKKDWRWRRSKSKDKKRKNKKSRRDKHGKRHKRSKSSSTKNKKPSADDGKDKKHWIEEEFLQPGPHRGKTKKHSRKHKERKKKRVEEVLPVMETQPTPSLSERRKKKRSKEAAVEEVRLARMDMPSKTSDKYPVVVSETPIASSAPAPQPPPPAQREVDIVQPEKKELTKPDHKIYGVKPEKPAVEKEKPKMEPSLLLQRTQDDELSPAKPKIISPEPPKPKVSPQKSFSLQFGAMPLPSPRPPSSGKESLELLPTVLGEKLRVNIDEILRLGGIMERRGISTSKKMSFEWIALNRHIVHQQPEAFSSHLIAAVGDVRLEKSLACDALNVLMYQHTVSPDEYLRLCQHLDTVQPITIGLLAQLLKTNTLFYSSVHNLRSQTLQCDALPMK